MSSERAILLAQMAAMLGSGPARDTDLLDRDECEFLRMHVVTLAEAILAEVERRAGVEL